MNEREEAEAEDKAMREKVDVIRAEVARIAAGARSLYLVGITPSGEMVNLCFYAGYADIRAMQIEAEERLAEIVATQSQRLPSQSV